MRFSLVIPCYNEASNLSALVERCRLITRSGEIEVVLVDNGSTDESDRVLSESVSSDMCIRVVRVEQNQGYGFGILSGLREGRGEILGWTHADLQTDPLDSLRGLALFNRYGDDIFVKGRRRGRLLGDRVFTWGMSLFETVLLGARMWDINAQPTMFSRAFFASWQDPPHDFSLDLFAYFQARRARLPVHRFDVVFPERIHGMSHWNINLAAKWKFICRTTAFSLELKKRVT